MYPCHCINLISSASMHRSQYIYINKWNAVWKSSHAIYTIYTKCNWVFANPDFRRADFITVILILYGNPRILATYTDAQRNCILCESGFLPRAIICVVAISFSHGNCYNSDHIYAKPIYCILRQRIIFLILIAFQQFYFHMDHILVTYNKSM